MYITRAGYVQVSIKDHPLFPKLAFVYEHRKVMAEHLGRSLARNEHVHHRNGDRADNHLDNLELVPAGEHQRRHKTGTKYSPEHCAAISAAKKGKKQPWARACGLKLKGRKRSDEFKRKVSEGMKRFRAAQKTETFLG